MGAGSSRRHHGNRPATDAAQQPQAPPTYPYPVTPYSRRSRQRGLLVSPQYPFPQRGAPRDPAGFVPFPPYAPGMQQFGQTRQQQLPPTHGHHTTPPPHGSSATGELHQTKTIRNRVNLKKSTLKMERLEDEDDKLIPRFVFDASEPCSVTVFYMAQEDAAKKSKLVSIMQEPGPRSMYSKGLGQVFPPHGKEKEYALDLNAYMEEDLTSVKGDVTFPLIIRLETVTDTTTEGHSLDELEPGSPTPTWVQSQTTYAYLIKDGNKWELRIVKQKIWVDGISYELQEIYGIQDLYSQEKKKSDEVDTYTEDIEGRECVICLASLRDTTVLPCRHMCMCASCARELQRQQVSTCPICREPIESLLHIKRPDKKNHEADAVISNEKSTLSTTEAVKSTSQVEEL